MLHPANTVLMIRPLNFGFNPETAASNSFQNPPSLRAEELNNRAVDEFDLAVDILRAHGINVLVFEDTLSPLKTDAVFPNNWFSTHRDLLITYPMESPTRRLERRQDIIEVLINKYGFSHNPSLETYENQNQFLEGTGSLVFDHLAKVAYACRSSRTNPKLVEKLAAIINYESIIFNSVDHRNKPVYHTNVMMCIGFNFVVICLDSIPDEDEKALIKSKFIETNRDIIPISQHQMAHFAGNMLELRDEQDNHVLVMSRSAYNALENVQKEKLSEHCKLIVMDIPVIEQVSGGSIRCMMAEIFY